MIIFSEVNIAYFLVKIYNLQQDVLHETKMIKIADVVREIVYEDSIALTSMRRGIMNFTNYARLIKKEVEDKSFKKVDLRSIVVTLGRISKEVEKDAPELYSSIKLLNLSVHSDLKDVTYERTRDSIEKLKSVYQIIPENSETFFTATESMSELTIVGDTSIINKIQKLFLPTEPKYSFSNLTGVTAKFGIDYLDIPNVIFRISQKIAMKKINIIELVSTTTEITYIIEKKNTEIAVSQLSKLL